MKKKLMVRLLGVAIVAMLLLFGCEGTPEPTAISTEDAPVVVKQEKLRSHLESLITTMARDPQTLSPDILDDLSTRSVLLNRIPAFKDANPYLTIEETGKQYRVVVSRFSGSRNASNSEVIFALDPDRFFPNQPISGYRAVFDDGPSLQKSVRLQTEVIENLTPRSTVDYALVFVDIERMVDQAESETIWNELIRGSKIYSELKIPNIKSALPCEECGGGGGGGNPPPPKPYLVLMYIKLLYDMDSGDDECELYIREDSGSPSIPGGSVKPSTGLVFSGDVRNDGAGRSRWFPNVNNAGDEYGNLDIALWPLSDSYPVSFVGIEDDDEMYVHDYTGSAPKTVNMYWEYRRDTDNYYSNTGRKFDNGSGVRLFYDSDDIWQTSHFANFTASNMVEDQVYILSLGDFIVHLKKDTF